MSRAIRFKFFESASQRISMEEGLNKNMEIEGFVEGGLQDAIPVFVLNEQGQDFFPALETNSQERTDGYPDIRCWKEGPMTFIEIRISSHSNSGGLDINENPISEAIISDKASQGFKHDQKVDKINEEAHKDVSLVHDDSILAELEQINAFADDRKFLDEAERDFSLDTIEESKALPPHESHMRMSELFPRSREHSRVRRRTEAKCSHFKQEDYDE